MVTPTSPTPTAEYRADTERLVDLVIELQGGVILNLSSTLSKGNVSFPQFFLLAYLASEEYLTMTDIAKKMGHSTAAATGLVDRMEKLGFVERIHAAEDRRIIKVQITSRGVEFVAKMRIEIKKELETLLSDWKYETDEALSGTKIALETLKPKK